MSSPFNTMFKMVVRPGPDDLGGTRDTLTMGTDTRFIFTESIVTAIGPDVQLIYDREQVGYFEAWAI